MGDAARRVLEAAMALTPEERRLVVDALDEADPDPSWALAWTTEAERRVAADPDGARSKTWDEVEAQVRQRLSTSR